MLSERVLCNLNPDIITLDYACAIGKGEKKKNQSKLGGSVYPGSQLS